MHAHIKKLWVNDLRTTAAPQAQLALFDGTGYCCLGRLCDLHRQETGEGEWILHSDGWYYTLKDGIESKNTMLPIAVIKWAGLQDSDPIIGNDRRASYHNDLLKKTFSEIAELIEANISEQVL